MSNLRRSDRLSGALSSPRHGAEYSASRRSREVVADLTEAIGAYAERSSGTRFFGFNTRPDGGFDDLVKREVKRPRSPISAAVLPRLSHLAD